MEPLQFYHLGERPERPKATVVFVHGLDGDPFLTWGGSDGDGYLWPLWLSRNFPDFAVLTLRYPAAVTEYGGSAMWLEDRARSVLDAALSEPKLGGNEPLAFVCHSFGGLVVKQALQYAQQQAERRKDGDWDKAEAFLDRVSRIVFLATPHLGADLALWADRFREIALPSASTRSLEYGSKTLRALYGWYRLWSVPVGIRHLVFVENERTPLVTFLGFTVKSAMIVSPVSADAAVEVEPVLVDSDHNDICKFKSPESPIYKRICEFLSTLPAGRDNLAGLRSERLRVSPNRLPMTTADHLLGRSEELAQLLAAWKGGKTRTIVVDAMGGEGKTALIHHFMQNVRAEDYRGLRRVFTWSFYSQGTDENRHASSEDFFDEALIFFGFGVKEIETEQEASGRRLRPAEIQRRQRELIKEDLRSTAKKGEVLRELIRSQPSLVVLDGFEPQQYPSGRTGGGSSDSGIEGGIKDRGLAILVRDLADHNPGGILLMTTRLRVRDLESEGVALPTVLRIRLKPISLLGMPSPAVELLEHLGVRGNYDELQRLAEDLRGNALALSQFARLLVEKHDGDVRRRDRLPVNVFIGGKNDSRSPFRVMRAYEVQFEEEIGRQVRISYDLAAGELLRLDKQELSTSAGRILAVLYILGLFDRKIERQLLEIVLTRPGIEGLTIGMVEAELENRLDAVLLALRRLGLIAAKDPDEPNAIDCHPLVREYFGLRLSDGNPKAWRDAHERLYDHYRYLGLPERFRTPEAYGLLVQAGDHSENIEALYELVLDLLSGRQPEGTRVCPSLIRADLNRLRAAGEIIGSEEFYQARDSFLPADEKAMAPSLNAIGHGCAAGLVREAWFEVYRPRIARGKRAYVSIQLGRYGDDLAALANFFERPFDKPNPNLSEADQALVLGDAAYNLRALGRTPEAVAPLRSAVILRRNLVARDPRPETYNELALNAGNLSQLLVLLGRIDAAVDAACDALEAACLSGIVARRVVALATKGNAVFEGGRPAEAELLFSDAEALEREPERPLLGSLRGQKYCDLRLAQGRTEEALWRAHFGRKFAESDEVALCTLSIGRVYSVLAQQKPGGSSPTIFDRDRRAGDEDYVTLAEQFLNEAVDLLSESASVEDISRGYLARAEFRRGQRRFEEAAKDVEHSLAYARRAAMCLLAIDGLIEEARCHLAGHALEAARASLCKAERLIETTYREEDGNNRTEWGYRIGSVQLHLTRAAIADVESSRPAARSELQLAASQIEAGLWGQLPEFARLVGRMFDPTLDRRLVELETAAQAFNVQADALWQPQVPHLVTLVKRTL